MGHLKRRSRGSTASERGAVAVEFALIVPLLFVLILGTVTAGVAYSRAVGVTNAVREGARLGATSDARPAMANQWAKDVVARVRDSQFDDPGRVTSVCVQLWKVGSGAIASHCESGDSPLSAIGGATSSPQVPNAPVGSCIVRVAAARPVTINALVTSWTRDTYSSATARYERKDLVTGCK